MSQLKLFLFGPPRLERQGRAVALRRRKVWSLLAYLATTQQSHSRDTLATLFWPDHDRANARANLRRELSRLNKFLGANQLQIEREQVSLNHEAKLWFDIDRFQQLVAQNQSQPVPDCLPGLTEAATLYTADFLAGFSLSDSPAFDEWQFFQAEGLRQQLASALQRLADGHSSRGEFELAISFARRWLELDPLHEPAQRQLMQVYAWAGQRTAALRQFEVVVRLLHEELGLPPSEETAELYQAIKEKRVLPPKLPPLSVRTPPFLQKKHLLEQDIDQAELAHSAFVARERELAQLNTFLDKALTGQGGVVFVTGETGQGKTRLVNEFARRAQATHADLIAAGGQCHAYTGLGNPFMPFLDVMAMLTGSKEATWIADALTQEHAFEQYVSILQGLATQHPLLLTLDDLQWVDAASSSLLFHLSRRIDRNRILIVGAYRPDEVALGRNGQEHPLEKIVGEFKRNFGDIWLALDQSSQEDEGQNFVNALLDTELNQLDEAFRQTLFLQTRGHALFTVELLRAMQARGDLVQDATQGWVEGPTLDWQTLPARVEGAIEERIGRLGPNLYELLRVASVEGETFTVEVVAQVQRLNQRQRFRHLSQALEKRHRLVRERAEVKAGQQLLSRYQFTHVLFQRYFYDNLSAGERRLLHGEVAQALEAIYEGHTDEIAVQLVYHFREAGQRIKALEYARQAAQQAKAVYAYDEASQHLQTALNLLEAEEQVETRLALLEELADVHSLRGSLHQVAQAIYLYQAALEQWSSLTGADKTIAIRLHRKILQTAWVMVDFLNSLMRRPRPGPRRRTISNLA